ncbi:DUF6056 family protein [Butyrivibrio sp. YAB3001]|uniref:DUF6056 family protein n=1 Tax=Butyrivibrio sp. YAB3001 TaxID=1520812 RepID=UPI0008F637FB|nr:hypothetical protein [Butyrivibrio sp. YAB3001]SFC74100.1 hypothetical protein SAMN02910398_03031 [Butyrivibrio sp. YAB3001]
MVNKKRQELFSIVLGIILFMLLLVPYIMAAFYANLSADDWMNIAKVNGENGNGVLDKTLLWVTDIYLNWQGTYSGSFFTGFGGMIYQYGGGMRWIHIEYAFAIILFFITFFALILRLLRTILGPEYKKGIACISATLMMFIILHDYNVSEVFFWHTGLCMYTLPICAGLMMFSLLLNERKNRTVTLICSLLALISVGGALNIAAAVCFGCLSYLVFVYVKKENYIQSIIIFVFAVMGAMINVAAPGNYTRHSGNGDGFNIVSSIQYALMGVCKRNIGFCIGYSMPFLFLIALLLYNFVLRAKLPTFNPIIMGLVFIALEAIIDFPVYLGYSSDFFPVRCEFLSRIVSITLMLLWLIDFISWYGEKWGRTIDINRQFVVLTFVIILIACTPFWHSEEAKSYFPVRIYLDLASGELRKYENANQMILEALTNAENEDVVIEVYEYSNVEYMEPLRLSDDPNYWVNRGMLSYFSNVKSISVNYK